MTNGKPEHFTNDEINGYCVKHAEKFGGESCLRCHPLRAIEGKKVREPIKYPESTNEEVKEPVSKVTKLRAGKNQLSELFDKIRVIVGEAINEPDSITYAEIEGLLDRLKIEYHKEWWLEDETHNDIMG